MKMSVLAYSVRVVVWIDSFTSAARRHVRRAQRIVARGQESPTLERSCPDMGCAAEILYGSKYVKGRREGFWPVGADFDRHESRRRAKPPACGVA